MRNKAKIMRKILIGVFLLLTLSSCLTTARIKRNRAEILSVLGTQNSSVVYKDTTIFLKDTIQVKLPKDTAFISDTVFVNNGVASLRPVTAKNGIVSATAWIEDNKLKVKSWINVPHFDVFRTDTVTITKVIKETNTVTTVVEKKIPTAYRYAFWIVLAQILVFIGWLLLKFNSFGLASKVAKITGKLF